MYVSHGDLKKKKKKIYGLAPPAGISVQYFSGGAQNPFFF